MKKKIISFTSLLVIFILAIVVLFHFESSRKPQEWNKIKIGMSVVQAKQLIGSPYQDSQELKGLLIWRDTRILGFWELFVLTDEKDTIASVVGRYKQRF